MSRSPSLAGVTQVAAGSLFSLAVTTFTRVPSVISDTTSAASSVLQASGFVPGQVTDVPDYTCNYLGVIKSQTPTADTWPSTAPPSRVLSRPELKIVSKSGRCCAANLTYAPAIAASWCAARAEHGLSPGQLWAERAGSGRAGARVAGLRHGHQGPDRVDVMVTQPLDPDHPPAWAIESVHLSACDPRWPGRAAEYVDELRPVLDQWLLGPIEHVGSTAIPGIVAKPVIDLMAQVADTEAVAGRAGGTLDGMNWKYVPPELDGRPWRRFFAKVSPDGRHRLAHLHLMSAGAARWGQQLRFRDALRASPALREEYGAIKLRLASIHADDREAYTDEKAAFVTGVMRDLDAAEPRDRRQ